ncbi:MAG TPA: nickel pincer cofactor biosynthesis protein LarC [Candidatus Tectomicrobia bacterium]|nr:nickel pincer cofactor biosynthesis protein LarC [Candidatus Tectomicrobia bacterium]
MRTAYFDCFSGISGDMTIGALVDAGASFEALRAQLARLQVPGYELTIEKVLKQGVAGTKFQVHVNDPGTQHRRLSDIDAILRGSRLESHLQDRALAVFTRLAEAEATIHHTTIDQVYFHEVGAIDSIIDIIGSVVGLDLLGVKRVVASAVNVGTGFVRAAHGVLPVPGPATAELLKGAPTYARGNDGELTTPTGAALLATLAERFGPLPHLRVEQIGYGAGTKDLSHAPNLLRVFIGDDGTRGEADVITVLEANLDDMNPEWFEFAQEQLFTQGALDVFYTAIFMKKNRPATKLTVLCETGNVDAMVDTLFRNTSTFGVRAYEVRRQKLRRVSETVDTTYGPIAVKIGQWRGQVVQISPEYESCRQAARRCGVPLKEIYAAAEAQARTVLEGQGPA